MPTTHSSLRFWTAVQLLVTSVLVIGVCALAYFSIQTHDALCTFRADLASRAANTQSYLDADPKADPVIVFGLKIPRDQMESTLRNQQATLDALGSLRCGP